ncbi:MAG: ribosomal RNA small subunit methyltransferase A [Proteobacteria bacterium]|nr:ribosomal RNA small subunit methyltransferase A [Pseudomonadota bacterium]
MAPPSGRFEDPRVLLKRYNLRPKRSWGQNFLVSERAVRTIAEACVDKSGRTVIEIGAGLGTLTKALLNMGGHVIAVERDREMCEVLRSEFGDQTEFELIEADAKKLDYAAYLHGELGVVAGNLPYQLTGPLLRKVMEIGPSLKRAVLMIQQEVADRLVATESDKARGALSVIIQARCQTRTLLKLSEKAFHPRPRVRSSVVMLEPRDDLLFGEGLKHDTFDRVVKAAFSSRRKTLRNALVSGGMGSVKQVEEILNRAGIDPKIRPQKVKECDFTTIASFF